MKNERPINIGCALAFICALAALPLRSATFVVVNTDAPGEGFNDPTPVAPVTGNAGITRGQQRLNAFNAAAAYWSNRLVSPVQIVVSASFDSLTCTPTSGILGSAGPVSAFANFPGAPLANTWYVGALADARRGSDLQPGFADLVARFNSRLDDDPGCLQGLDWFYGIGVVPPAGGTPFYETVRHELAHGLGFLTLVDLASGQRLQNLDDAFMAKLEDHSTAKSWPQMTNFERAISAVDAGDLHWIGGLAIAAGNGLSAGRHPGGHIRMFNPNPLMPGSSVSHWDTVLVPDEMMEPFATPTTSDVVTTALLEDIGWVRQQAPSTCVRDATTACLQSNRFEVKVTWATAAPATGSAQVMSFGGQRTENDESVFFNFFSATNFEMGVKVLNACVPVLGNKYWVFVSGLTDQGWTVTVRDTLTGAVKTYSNATNHLSTTFADTLAFGC